MVQSEIAEASASVAAIHAEMATVMREVKTKTLVSTLRISQSDALVPKVT